jgi:hypothetical protein
MAKEIPIHPNKGVALVDDEDYERVMEHRWNITDNGYVHSQIGGKRGKWVLLHRFVMNASNGKEIDHKDQNKLNCQKSNLRFCSRSQNLANTVVRKSSVVKYKGVDFDKRRKLFRASISLGGKYIHLGYFKNPKDAAIAYDNAAKDLYGEFSRPNFEGRES